MTGKDLKEIVKNLPDDLPVYTNDPEESGGMIDLLTIPQVMTVYEYQAPTTTWIDSHNYQHIQKVREYEAIVFEL